MVTRCEVTPKVMLPGCSVKPLNGGELPSFDIFSKQKTRELLLSKDTDIASKIRCLFFGRFYGDEESAEILSRSLDYSDSVLFRHEVLYVLGQMGLRSPLDRLYGILGDESEHPMVRHEAGEAIAAIGEDESLEVVERYLEDKSPAVRETCYLAAHSLRLKREKKRREVPMETGEEGAKPHYSDVNAFNTTDPTPPEPSCEISQVESLSSDLLDEKAPLEKKYAALFALRNILTGIIDHDEKRRLCEENYTCTPEDSNCQEIHFIAGRIAQAMETDRTSAVFRHECAFVLGQIQIISTANALSRVVSDVSEESMVRHEAAFALGSVGSSDPRAHESLSKQDSSCTIEELRRVRKLAIETLQKFSHDQDRVVAESCVVGLQTILDETGSIEVYLA
ncbi:Deoxyhypusine hydroxylase [Cryptosporidium felis]|nr:Deoxyhypusine hydroxylase [Cryptosporidium felis]